MQILYLMAILWFLGSCGSVSPGERERVLIDDTASELRGQGAVEQGAVVTDHDAIAPVAYYTGGLLARASDAVAFTSAPTADWANIQAVAATSTLSVMSGLDMEWRAATPPGLGLTHGDEWTQWYEGELYLDAGAWTFSLIADDHAFVEIAAPGTDGFERVVAADWPATVSGRYMARAAGWYPIRIALTEERGHASIRLTYASSGGNARSIPGHALRFRADHLRGWTMVAWDDVYGVGNHAMRIDESAPAHQNWGMGRPRDIGLSDDDEFTVGWAGQVRIEEAGAYSFRLSTDNGQRLWVGGVELASAWNSDSHDTVTIPITLEPGWHDMVVEVTEFSGAARAMLTVADGPAWAGMALPVQTHLRPVIARGPRYATGGTTAPQPIPNAGKLESEIVLDAPLGATVSRLDARWSLTHSAQDELAITLIAPDGTRALLRNRQPGMGPVTERAWAVLHGTRAGGTWRLLVEDLEAGGAGTLQDFQLTVHYLDGGAVVPADSAFESGIRDLGGGVESIDAVSWAGVVPAGASVHVRVRTGDTEAACQAAEWSEPITEPGELQMDIDAGRYMQYRVEFTSNGTASPWIDRVEVGYTVAAE